MKKNWITGLTVASVVGTGGAAFAGMRATTHDAAEAAAESPTSTVAPTMATVAAPVVKTFAVAEAGLVQVSLADGVITVDSSSPNTGWSVVSFTPPAAHVEVVFTDGTRIVTFAADAVNGEIEAGVADTTPTTSTSTTVPVTPATPAPQPTVLVPSTRPPSSAHTTAASGSGDDDDEHESDDEGEGGDDD